MIEEDTHVGEGGFVEGEKVPQIFAVDDQDSTWYVLIRDGWPPVAAHWPSTLLEVCPEAVMGGTLGCGEPHARTGEVNGHLDDYKARVYAHGSGGGSKKIWEQDGVVNLEQIRLDV